MSNLLPRDHYPKPFVKTGKKGEFGEKEYDKHLRNVKMKHDRIQGLKDLILTHELNNGLFDHKYVMGLRKKLRQAEVQLKSMA